MLPNSATDLSFHPVSSCHSRHCSRLFVHQGSVALTSCWIESNRTRSGGAELLNVVELIDVVGGARLLCLHPDGRSLTLRIVPTTWMQGLRGLKGWLARTRANSDGRSYTSADATLPKLLSQVYGRVLTSRNSSPSMCTSRSRIRRIRARKLLFLNFSLCSWLTLSSNCPAVFANSSASSLRS